MSQREAMAPEDKAVELVKDWSRDARPSTQILSIAEAIRNAVAETKEDKDRAYEERNRCVALIAKMAQWAGWNAGITHTEIDGWNPEWHGCVYIDLPTGQVSWHYHDSQAGFFSFLPTYDGEWDGHETPEKYNRVADMCHAQLGPTDTKVSATPSPSEVTE